MQEMLNHGMGNVLKSHTHFLTSAATGVIGLGLSIWFSRSHVSFSISWGIFMIAFLWALPQPQITSHAFLGWSLPLSRVHSTCLPSGTIKAWPCLASEIRWDRVPSGRYGCRQSSLNLYKAISFHSVVFCVYSVNGTVLWLKKLRRG